MTSYKTLYNFNVNEIRSASGHSDTSEAHRSNGFGARKKKKKMQQDQSGKDFQAVSSAGEGGTVGVAGDVVDQQESADSIYNYSLGPRGVYLALASIQCFIVDSIAPESHDSKSACCKAVTLREIELLTF